jgi:hypothetical protein
MIYDFVGDVFAMGLMIVGVLDQTSERERTQNVSPNSPHT